MDSADPLGNAQLLSCPHKDGCSGSVVVVVVDVFFDSPPLRPEPRAQILDIQCIENARVLMNMNEPV
ncbi:hypothetical protein TYRP_002211 [Tyrophagus putrescentiae]|nr:hypothetical protein TYRP_002211 [Tyrophagus putrescentiae]